MKIVTIQIQVEVPSDTVDQNVADLSPRRPALRLDQLDRRQRAPPFLTRPSAGPPTGIGGG
jgi:hypothetical protein